MWHWSVFIIVALAGPILTERRHHHRNENCDRILAEAISKFVTSSVDHSHNLLLWTVGVEEERGGVGVDSVRGLGKALKLDLVDPGQQRELSILLCYAPSLTFLSRAFEIDFEVFDDFMETYVEKVYFHKKLDVLLKVGDLLMEMLQWTRQYGYPITPLRHHPDPDDVMTFLQGMEDRLQEDRDVRDLWFRYNRHFPIGQDLDLGEVALLLTCKHSLSRVAEQLGLQALELEQLSKLDDAMLYQYLTNVAATLRLYKVLDEFGISRLQWK